MVFSSFLKKWYYDIDHFTFNFAIFLIFIGLLLSFTISPAMTARIGIENSYHFSIHHLLFSVIGILLMLFCSMFSKDAILSFSFFGYFCCLCFLVLVLFIGGSTKGSHRWINLGFFALQPSEIMKPFFIVCNAYFLTNLKNKSFGILISLVNACFLTLLFVLQPDFGTTALYIFITALQLLFCGLRLKILFGGVSIFGILLSIIGFFFFPHFHYRIVNFFHFADKAEHYQTKKALESIHNGGVFGKSLGEGEIKYQLPDAHTDYIFSVLCEELGALFACLLLIMIAIFAYRHVISSIYYSKDNLYEFVAIFGFIAIFVFQTFVHIGVNLNIFPSKGMTFPFLSYGGSSMLSSAIIFGFLLAFTRKSYRFKSPYRFFENV